MLNYPGAFIEIKEDMEKHFKEIQTFEHDVSASPVTNAKLQNLKNLRMAPKLNMLTFTLPL